MQPETLASELLAAGACPEGTERVDGFTPSEERRNVSSTVRCLAGTGLAFLLFTGGTFLFASYATLLPIIVRDTEHRRKHVQSLLSKLFRFFHRTIERFGLISIRVEGLERLSKEKSCVFVANHPTLIDAPILLGMFPRCTCLVKGALLESWKYRTLIRELEYLPIGKSQYLFSDCVRMLQSGRSLLAFPEGTRTGDGLPIGLSRGAALIALRAGVELVPIMISCDPPTLRKGSRWFQIPDRRIDFRIAIHYPFVLENAQEDPRQGLRDMSERAQSVELTRRLEEFFRSQGVHGE